MSEELILRRTIELLVAAGHVTQENVDKARAIVISYTKSEPNDGEATEPPEEIGRVAHTHVIEGSQADEGDAIAKGSSGDTRHIGATGGGNRWISEI